MSLTDPGTPGATAVTVWDLEMLAPPEGPGPSHPSETVSLMRSDQPAPELSRFFYRLVGQNFSWADRRGWSMDQWLAWVDRPELHLWTCWSGGAPAGYFELEQQGEGAVELAYFGLVERYRGKGIGSWLLRTAIDTAWALPGTTTRFWLHTCSLDSPVAKPNYLARGFTECGQSTEYRLVTPPAA